MVTYKWAFLLVAFGALVISGCQEATTSPAQAESVAPALCGECGQIKGGDACCAADAVTCDKCGLAKGSPGCCKITKGTDAELCTKCGQIKDTDACCAEGAVACDKCGLTKGSPGCCKIGTAT